MKIRTRFIILIGTLLVAGGIIAIVLVNQEMRRYALVEAESRARDILDQSLAIHTYFSQQLKPKLFELTDSIRSRDYFEPTWMSSTYAIREINKYHQSLEPFERYYKECAVNARSPEYEADDNERAFLEEMQKTPELTVNSGIRSLNEEKYFEVLRRGEAMEESCLRCHGDPAHAPDDLVRHYGPQRSFHRKVGDVVQAISIRVPLSAAFALADGVSFRLSAGLLVLLFFVLSTLYFVSKKWIFKPIDALHTKALTISEGSEHLGEQIPLPAGKEMEELTAAFNRMSQNLRNGKDQLEAQVKARTAALEKANQDLKTKAKEQKQVEDALRESEEKLRSIFVNMLNGVAYCRMLFEDGKPQDFIYLAVNDAFESQTGLKDVVGKKVTEVIPGIREADPQLFEIYARVAMTGRPERCEVFIEVLQAWFSLSVYSPMREFFVVVFDVITERKHAEQEKEKLQAQLQQSQKMEAIGTLAGGIAHDFNNILTPIIMQTELALLNLPDKNPIKRGLEDVLKASSRAKSLVNQILAFSRQTTTEVIPLNMAPIVKEALKLLRSALPSTIEVRQSIRSDTGTVLADPTQIHQVLMNLCTNAAQAMTEKGGVLEVRLAETETDGQPRGVDCGPAAGRYVKLSVADTGPGIDPSIREKIFEPFFSTKNPGEGTGMGLAVVYGIVKRYGGNVEFESEVGKGATFHVLFPIAEAVQSTREMTVRDLPRGNEHILLVDDEKAMVASVESGLKFLGYQVTTRTSSIEALEAFRRTPAKFDLVITDQTMPNMPGDRLAQEILSIRSNIPIILCTGFSQVMTEQTAKEIGIREFIMKPIVMSELAEGIRNALH